MSLVVLAAFVVAGIGLVVAAVHLTGGSAVIGLDDDAAAVARFAQDFPEQHIGAVCRTRDGRTAFLRLDSGRVGIVQAVGGKFLTRIVSAAGVNGAPRARGAQVTIRFRDFTWPGGSFIFEHDEDARAVEAMFAGLRSRTIWEEAA